MAPDNLRYRDAPARRGAIIDQLKNLGFLTIGEVAKELGVSEMTVRRDARRLHEEGRLIALRGTLRLPSSHDESETEYQRRAAAATTAKEMVGRIAASEVLPGDVIAIDAGTTAFQVARALPEDFDGTVVTHSIPVLDLLIDRPMTKTIALGGDLYRPSRALVGSFTVECAQRLSVRTFYMGAAAVDERGVYALGDVERLVKQTLMSIADRVVLVIDNRKFDVKAPVFMCDWSRFSLVVSDQVPPDQITALLRQKNIQIQVASEG
ncbi:DeoR/GlpR family DNA-binding transcription regulator [Rhodopseudomonas palustris]|uniref:Transcriptional regulator, DeoR family n=1 Tax=Rhodopseudomonas palustris (strain BisB18) TaxID=316056 RepID=Q21AI1_RHOPB